MCVLVGGERTLDINHCNAKSNVISSICVMQKQKEKEGEGRRRKEERRERGRSRGRRSNPGEEGDTIAVHEWLHGRGGRKCIFEGGMRRE